MNPDEKRTRSRQRALALSRRTVRACALGLVVAVPSISCSDADLGDEWVAGDLGIGKQALAGYGSAQWAGPVAYWDLNDYYVPVCYLTNPNNAGSDSGYFDEFVAANAEVEATVGLTIDWTGACPSPVPSDFLPVVFDDQNGGSGLAAPGFGKRRTGGTFPGTFQIGVGIRSDRFAFKRTAVHEFLHALGMVHEQQRTDSEPSCSLNREDGNNVFAPGADFLTPYDDQSIMNYCRTSASGSLTYFDRVGLGILYPKAFSRPIFGNLAFYGRDAVVTRTNGQLYTDWTLDGASDAAISSISWRVTGVEVGTEPTLPVSNLAAGSITLSGGLDDFGGRDHDIVPTKVIVSNAQHTAIVSAVVF